MPKQQPQESQSLAIQHGPRHHGEFFSKHEYSRGPSASAPKDSPNTRRTHQVNTTKSKRNESPFEQVRRKLFTWFDHMNNDYFSLVAGDDELCRLILAGDLERKPNVDVELHLTATTDESESSSEEEEEEDCLSEDDEGFDYSYFCGYSLSSDMSVTSSTMSASTLSLESMASSSSSTGYSGNEDDSESESTYYQDAHSVHYYSARRSFDPDDSLVYSIDEGFLAGAANDYYDDDDWYFSDDDDEEEGLYFSDDDD